MAKTDLTAEELRKLFTYSEKKGLFVRRYEFSIIKRPVGYTDKKGYLVIGIDGYLHKAHRLAWLYVHGEWPEGQIDHIDGCKANNKMSNLRVVTNAINGQNIRKASKRSTSGLLGACKRKNGKWSASISVNKVYKYLGTFDTAKEAHKAYVAAKRVIHEGCTI